jgi:hypothetical protein
LLEISHEQNEIGADICSCRVSNFSSLLPFWNLDSKFNFFRLPAQGGGLAGGSSQHALRAFLVKLNFVLCPPLVITVVGMDLGTTANFLLWGLSLALNTVLYFVLGLILRTLWNGLARSRKRLG